MTKGEFDQVQRDIHRLYLTGEMTEAEFDVAIASLNAERRKLAVETDTKLAELFDQMADAAKREGWAIDSLHHLAGDRREYYRGARAWKMADALVIELAQDRVAQDAGRYYQEKSALERLASANAQQAEIRAEIGKLDAVYREHGWHRYFLVTNGNGHVHRDMLCRTCFPTTEYAWIVELADCDEAAMIEEFGEKACTVCFPDAPANPAFHAPGRRDREAQAARQAEKDARQARNDAKRLAADEVFRSHHGDNVSTVAACKQAIRDEIELRNYGGRGPHPWHRDAVKAAEQAKRVLMAREARHEGWGATQAQIDKIIANKVKAEAKLWA